MRGISPVIATILLLLFVVAAVGGVWVWYQRQQSTIQTSSEQRLTQEVSRETAAQIVLSGVYSSGSYLAMIISNPSSKSATVTGYKIRNSTGTYFTNTSVSLTVPAGSSTSFTTKHTVSSICSSGQTIKIQLFVSGIATPVYTEDCPG